MYSALDYPPVVAGQHYEPTSPAVLQELIKCLPVFCLPDRPKLRLFWATCTQLDQVHTTGCPSHCYCVSLGGTLCSEERKKGRLLCKVAEGAVHLVGAGRYTLLAPISSEHPLGFRGLRSVQELYYNKALGDQSHTATWPQLHSNAS